ncbi:hypothetical protein N836_34665 [Leptolyngbya sp. Heron Island J]|nr:hypothetical protein N836_34665 [Leptolyngbya sp. Heron Island J]
MEAVLVKLVLLGSARTSEPNWIAPHNQQLLAAQKIDGYTIGQLSR